jgi:RNA polymerase sigma-70 factor (ECF subfamily)
MSSRRPDLPSVPAGAERFATTHWSLVLAARDRAAPESRDALAALCATYWYPLYAFVRRRGHDADQAQDLTQEFFVRLLEKDYLQVVDRDKGKFRAFLLAAFGHFLLNEYDRAKAQKRGGGREFIPLDFEAAEGRYSLEPAHALTPERLFERRWALTLLDQVLARLRAEMVQAGKEQLYENLKVYLMMDTSAESYAGLAEELGQSAGAVKVAVHRLRKRYRALLREEIARTVDGAEQVEEEIRDLFTALG